MSNCLRCGERKASLTVPASLIGHQPVVSQLVLELVRRQRAGGRRDFFRYPFHTSMPLPPDHVKTPSGLRNSGWSGRGPHTRDQAIVVGCNDYSLGWSIERVRASEKRLSVRRSFLFGLDENWETTRKVLHASTLPIAHQNPPDGNIIHDDTKLDPSQPSSSYTRNQDSLETSSRESWTSHQ